VHFIFPKKKCRIVLDNQGTRGHGPCLDTVIYLGISSLDEIEWFNMIKPLQWRSYWFQKSKLKPKEAK
jgi:hypothetical protein